MLMLTADVSFIVQLLTLFLLLDASPIIACQAQTQFALKASSIPVIAFEQTWHSLGPFRIGTREAVWGADPIEAVGGFVDLPRSENTSFRSPLSANATVSWATHVFEVEHQQENTSVRFTIGYPDVDWNFQQQVYGWSALQYQTWARGNLQNHASAFLKAWIYPDNILEFYLNGQHFFGGDFFGFKRAPVLVDLKPGANSVNVRLIRDVRAMGGTNPPIIEATMRVRVVSQEPEIDPDFAMTPNIVDGKLPSRYLSLPIRNTLSEWIVIKRCPSSLANTHWRSVMDHFVIAPGQTRPFSLRLSDEWLGWTNVSGVLCYFSQNKENGEYRQLRFSLTLQYRTIEEASKFTFLHPSGTVSYAVLKPPKTRANATRTPILLLLHGAGVEADDDELKHSLDGVPDLQAFTLFPTGMSPWSGDDWHVWGATDALAAIEAVPAWAQAMAWAGTIPSVDRVVVAGHSNGGQGVWYFATHFPDRTIAAAPLSGYTSIENYVPYQMWTETDSLKVAVLNTARSSYRHELLLGNLQETPILQQHGSADDNVPPYHSRLMSTLRSELNLPSDYIEIPGQPHWWDGVLTTAPLQDFYRKYLTHEQPFGTPVENFSIVIPSCSIIESKFGIVVDQLLSPDRSGHIEVTVNNQDDDRVWHLATTNIRRLHLDFSRDIDTRPLSIYLDNSIERIVMDSSTKSQDSCLLEADGEWYCSNSPCSGIQQRCGRQRGALDAILRSRGPFEIVSCTNNFYLAVQVSRNMLQYFGADSVIRPCDQYLMALAESGNVILITSQPTVTSSRFTDFPVYIHQGSIQLRTGMVGSQRSLNVEAGLSAIFLRPLDDEKLEIVVWGWDSKALNHAARLIPTITGVGQPDFVVLGSRAALKGVDGALAMGFFDHGWNISRASYLS